MTQSKPGLRVTVFSDYICPFCYVGHVRLARLRAHYDLKVNWALLEIHPETSPAGEDLSVLKYPAGAWERMMKNLRMLADEENIEFTERQFTTNSRAALQLAEAAKLYGVEKFNRLHDRLFQAFFTDGENIGDTRVLIRLGLEAGLTEEQIRSAWTDPAVVARLHQSALAAGELSVRATPTFFIGEQRLDGAVPYQQLLDAARASV